MNGKVGICAQFENNNNYGTMLQAYATFSVISDLGYECSFVRYKRKYTPLFVLKQLSRVFEVSNIKLFLKKKKKKRLLVTNKEYATIYLSRDTAIKDFCKYYKNNVDTFIGYHDLIKGASNYDMFLVGSDQLWLPSGLKTNFYSLMFVPDNIKKISYATSIGVSQIRKRLHKKYKEYLTRIDFLSVREKRASEIIKEISNIDVNVVADPTLLLDSNCWDIKITPKKLLQDDYIFCYFLGRNKFCRDYANFIKKKTGLKIVVLKHLDEYIADDDSFGDFCPIDVGPSDFINYIRFAKYVLTDSFHGTVFSIINHKQFLSFYRFNSKSRQSRNSRIDSLLSIAGINDRIYKKTSFDIDSLMAKIDYDSVDSKIKDFRNESYSFLINALTKKSLNGSEQ